MNKLTILGVLVATMVFSTGCKKCQTCTTKITQDLGFFDTSTSSSQEYCGKEYDDAPAEGSVSQEVSGISQTVSIICVDE